MDSIEVIGAREHNLKGIDVTIPRGQFVVITGLSGSGKSSLAFDTIYAEGQRRYMETLSAYARQFIGILERPKVESITGLSPIIAIEQKTTGSNPRSTVGTITEIYDFLRLLYARASDAYSPVTGKKLVKYTAEQIANLIAEEYSNQKCYLLAPLVIGRKGHYKELLDGLLKKGFTQVRIDGTLFDLADVKPLDRYKVHFIELVVDKIIPSKEDFKRIYTSVNTALERGKGTVAIIRQGEEEGQLRFFSMHLMDADTGESLPEPAPFTFSFNSPQGACPVCKGLGYITRIDLERIIPDPSKTINGGGIIPIGKYKDSDTFRILEAMAAKYGFSLNTPIRDLPEDVMNMILYGTQELFRVSLADGTLLASFPGAAAKMRQSEEEEETDRKKKDQLKERYIEEIPCPECNGSRLKKEALYFKIDGKNIAQVAAMDISSLKQWVEQLPQVLDKRQNTIARDIIKELRDRIGFLSAVGLDYLSLDRGTSTLSGGESQRIRLATQIGSKLVNVLYILDEPSIGLHQRDNIKLINSLKQLRDEGNSVMVVEHDSQTMLSCDRLIDLGPGAGNDGGKLLFNLTPQELKKMPLAKVRKLGSLTAEYLRGLKNISIPEQRRKGNGKFLILKGATGNNLKGVDLKIPLGCLVGVSGVSGSGKSSLINQTLMPVLTNHFYRALDRPLPYKSVEGLENVDKVIVVDQSPIGRTPRSNPATYVNVFSDIRKLFEKTPDAQIRGFKAGRFSFNTKGGRCEVCKGAGVETIEMHYLPSVYVTCKECRGKRYNSETLEVKYKGKNIYDVLEMTISEAAKFFSSIPSIYPKLKAMEDVGLGYVKLGQPSTTLSGGESQRVKLSAELSRKDTGNSIFLLDEPTTGLHFEDIKVLLGVLQKIVDKGNTIIVIEHNLDVLKSVDYLIDMGPEGGQGGGRIIAEGTPEEVSRDKNSVTGKYLNLVF
ncbi:MAG: excinuclease ABC subunit UvrA [Bacteroidales bacterium]|nr:excinuclease ABC subunit UvrA [Bacteroidales bacterium]MBP5518340.1 excinuclease ABC subunit UvrA [Bacteroidales bacterium]